MISRNSPAAGEKKARTRRPLYRFSELIFWVPVLLVLLYVGGPSRKPDRESGITAKLYNQEGLLLSLDPADGPARTYEIPDYPGFILETNGEGAIRIQHSPCPDKLCMRAGYLRASGEQAVCLPLKLILRLESAEDHDEESYDLVIGGEHIDVSSEPEVCGHATDDGTSEERTRESAAGTRKGALE